MKTMIFITFAAALLVVASAAPGLHGVIYVGYGYGNPTVYAEDSGFVDGGYDSTVLEGLARTQALQRAHESKYRGNGPHYN